MLRLAMSVVLLVGIGLGGGGCASRVELAPTGSVAVTLQKEKKINEAKAGLQALVTITLPAAEAGYAWQISFHDPRYLKQMSELQSSAAGAPAMVKFLALHGGRTHLRFLLMPPNAGRDALPVDQQELVLTIQ